MLDNFRIDFNLPAIVFKHIKYSKLEIFRSIHFCVNPDDFNSSDGDLPKP